MPTLFRGAFSALAGQERHAAPRQAVWNLVSPSCPVCSLPRGTEPRGACSSVPSQGPRAALTVSLCLHPLWGHVLRMRVAPASLPLTPLCSAPRGRSFLRVPPLPCAAVWKVHPGHMWNSADGCPAPRDLSPVCPASQRSWSPCLLTFYG